MKKDRLEKGAKANASGEIKQIIKETTPVRGDGLFIRAPKRHVRLIHLSKLQHRGETSRMSLPAQGALGCSRINVETCLTSGGVGEKPDWDQLMSFNGESR